MIGKKYRNGKTSAIPCVREKTVEETAPRIVRAMMQFQNT
jgi:hypothetical protein